MKIIKKDKKGRFVKDNPYRFQRGHIPWNKGRKCPEISKAKKELYKDKTKNPFYSKKHTKEWKELMSNSMKGRKFTKEAKKKMSLAGKGKHHSPKTEFKKGYVPWDKGKKLSKEIKRKISKKLKELYKRGLTNPMLGKTKENYKQLRKISNLMKNGGALKARKANKLRPNKIEKFMVQLIKENNLPFNYVGDGKVWFTGNTQHFNPDFLSKNPKHIIEVFGDYWHRNTQEEDKERLNTYSKFGYKTLIIWEHELKNPFQVLNKINKFIEK